MRIPFYDLSQFFLPASLRKSLKFQIKASVMAEVASSSLIVPAILSNTPRKIVFVVFRCNAKERPVCRHFPLREAFLLGSRANHSRV